jgi:hypothetical protein
MHQDPHLQYGLPPMPVSGMRGKTTDGPGLERSMDRGMDRSMDRGMDLMDGHSSDEDSQVRKKENVFRAEGEILENSR